MSPATSLTKPCACGGRRQGNKSVCFPCWKSAPAALRQQSRDARTLPETRAAVRLLLEHARTRNNQPELL